MKISKLFHWLYAFLMFLPIVLFIPNAFYYGFNEHATNSETTTINYKYQSNEVNTLDDLVEGNIYYLDGLTLSAFTENLNFQINLLSFEQIEFNGAFDQDETICSSITFSGLPIYFTQDDDDFSCIIYFSDVHCYNAKLFDDDNGSIVLTNIIFYTTEYDTDEPSIDNFKSYCEDRNYLPQYTDYNVIDSVEVNTNDTISNKMYQAWQSTWNLPLLQWTHTSFVAQPFTYITGLFGVPSDSTLNYIFAYFVSISICWLVFDLLMYVPNLAHRWLDRSALE